MSDDSIQGLSQSEAIAQIVETIKNAEPGEAPFALVLGSGFSFGLVPTVRELVTQSLPLWMKSREEGLPFEQYLAPVDVRVGQIAGDFWRGFAERNASRGLRLAIDASGLPEDFAEAYKAAFNPRFRGAVGEPGESRKFQRALMRLEQPRLNAAHFLLASILGAQPRKLRASTIFRARAAFSRLILTTNFDPFLQTALQAVNRLYMMSDTPDLGFSDEILDDETDAIHLVYLHGSIHRRSQKATEAEIGIVKERNARLLAPVLKRRGVIVLGYSGWDDAIVEALAECDSFDRRLYWCGRRSDPESKGAFGPRVPGILRKNSACYVRTAGAGDFMAELCAQLVDGLPRLLANPIGQLCEMLECTNLDELQHLESGARADAKLPTGRPNPHVIEDARQTTLAGLRQAELVFLGKATPGQAVEAAPHAASESAEVGTAEDGPSVPLGPDTGEQVQRLIAAARLAESLNNNVEILKRCDEGLLLPGLKASDEAELRVFRGRASAAVGDLDAAISDFSLLVELAGAPIGWVALGLVNRGIAYDRKGESEEMLADFTRVIDDLPGAPVEWVALALYDRGISWSELGEPDKSVADYTRIIEATPDAPVEWVANALRNRGVIWQQSGAVDKALADYTRVIELSDAPVETVADALLDRGVIWQQSGAVDKALADYTRVIELSDSPVETVAKALVNRGSVWDWQGETDKEVAEYTHLIDDLPDAPVQWIARALVNRGRAWGMKGETEKELADFTRLIDELPGAPVEQIGQALLNRGLVWDRKGETDKEVAEYTRLIDALPGAPVHLVAQALVNRGLAWRLKGEMEKELADFTRVIDALPGAPVERIGQALLNRPTIWGQKGDAERELADYTRLIESLPGAPVEQVAEALVGRALAWFRKGDPDKEITDYTQVIEGLPGAPVTQVATALRLRAWSWRDMGKLDEAISDYTRLIEHLPDAPVYHVAQALIYRGVTWGLKGEVEKEIDDYGRVIEELPNAPVEEVAQALIDRGVAWERKGELERGLADYSRVIESLADVPADWLAMALRYRGMSWRAKGELVKSLADFTRVIENLEHVPPKEIAQALIGRGLTWGELGEWEKEMADYTRVIEAMPAAPTELVALALRNRGIVWRDQGELDKAVAEFTRVIEELPGCPVDEIVGALLSRRNAWSKKGDRGKEIADCTRIIEMQRAAANDVAEAFGSRGWARYEENDFAGFLRDTEDALKKNGALDWVAFNLGLALLANGRDVEALDAYQRAGEQFPAAIDCDGLEDLEKATATWLSSERAEPVRRLLESLRKRVPGVESPG